MQTININNFKGKEIAEGGEALIYSHNNKALKVYKSNIDKFIKEKKIKKILSKKMPKGVVAPLDILEDTNGNFIGYSMDKIKGEEFKKLCSKKYLKLNNITIKNISDMLFNLMEIIKNLHSNNIIIGDLNECNILFDKKFNIYLIDVDSWSVDNIKCTVAMESFQDPKMKKGEFTTDTDWYAFAILVFKCLTMLHPFGGTMDPDISILERMKKGISVLNNDKVIIPKSLCKGWKFFSPDLLNDLIKIFNKGERFCIEKSFTDFVNNLKFCVKHNDYYYSKYTNCPNCNSNVSIQKQTSNKPKKMSQTAGIPYVIINSPNNIKIMLNQDTYVDKNNIVHFVNDNDTYSYNNKVKYYSYKNMSLITNNNQIAINTGKQIYKFNKQIDSRIIVKNDSIYFMNEHNVLTELKCEDNGNILNTIQYAAFKNYFEVYDNKHYLIVNIYDNKNIICVDGFNHEMEIKYNVNNYGIHYDPITNQWIVIIEDTGGNFYTKVFKENKIIYESNKLRLSCNLGYTCHYNGILYIPKDGGIRGFNYLKNAYKDFECDIVSSDNKLIKTGPKFTLIKDNGIYEIG